jgi:hypothetical protein
LASLAALVYLAVRSRMRRVRLVRSQPARAPRTFTATQDSPQRLPRALAYGFLVLMLFGSGLFLALQWHERWQEVRVRVINTNSGSVQDYQARRRAIQERSFETLDGRRVILSAVERMEVGGSDP